MAQKKDNTLDPFRIWRKVEETDPNYTRHFKRSGGFQGTTVNPTHLVQKATKLWGPVGDKWGYNIVEEEIMEGAAHYNGDGTKIGTDLIHKILLEVWYINEEGARCALHHFGQTAFVMKNKYGLFTDEEAPKKSLTDALGKCLSMLGFSADIFLGMYDDSKYVNDVRKRYADQDPKPPAQAAPAKPQDTKYKIDIGKMSYAEYADLVIQRINSATDNDEVNQIIKANNATFSKDPEATGHIKKATIEKRMALADNDTSKLDKPPYPVPPASASDEIWASAIADCLSRIGKIDDEPNLKKFKLECHLFISAVKKRLSAEAGENIECIFIQRRADILAAKQNEAA